MLKKWQVMRVKACYTPCTFRQPLVPFLYPLYQGFRVGSDFGSILAVISSIANGRLRIAALQVLAPLSTSTARYSLHPTVEIDPS
jgi:hypothetical protein